jgi:hypothetical protein
MSILVIADSANNRYIVCDADSHVFIEQIGSGKFGWANGSFAESQFYHTQGLCHYQNEASEYCLLLCDVKNHCIREANLHTKQVRHVAGVPGVRGRDPTGGKCAAAVQELASPWDIVSHTVPMQFIVVMAGSHQIWLLDLKADKCMCFSGNGAEGNANSDPENSTWAQPSGITFGSIDGEHSYFIADSESSAIRAINAKTVVASNVVGANDDIKDLFDFGDKEGSGYSAKLQHPLGVHFSKSTLFVCDTYNHKIKRLCGQDGKISSGGLLQDWLGVSNDPNPRVVDGVGKDARLNEPNGCWAKIQGGQFVGLYIADTGNDCIRFASPDGSVTTPELKGVPDVRETSSDCVGGQCKPDFGSSDEEESKQQ